MDNDIAFLVNQVDTGLMLSIAAGVIIGLAARDLLWVVIGVVLRIVSSVFSDVLGIKFNRGKQRSCVTAKPKANYGQVEDEYHGH